MSLDENVTIIPFEVSLIVTHKNGLPAVELRRITTEPEIVKQIISAAFHGQTIILKPVFKDTLRSVSALAEKGIIYKDLNDGQYYFTF